MKSTALLFSDLHFPYADKKYLSIGTKLINKLKPDYVIQCGDALDFSDISTYLTHPKNQSKIFDEIEAYNKQLDIWQSAMKKGAIFHQLEGNHSERIQRYVSRNCREIHEIVKSIPDLLKFKERSKTGIKFVWHSLSNWKSCKIHDVIIHHGVFYDKNLAVSNLTRYQGIKFIQAHAHRYQTAYANGVWSVTLGHGSEAEKTNHISGPCQWQQGMGLITFIQGKGYFEPIIVQNGTTCFRGEIIRG